MGSEQKAPIVSKGTRLHRAFKFIRILRVEPFLFLTMFQFALKGMPSHQLLQDKICRSWYNQTVKYCHDLPSKKEFGPNPFFYKSRILADVNQFSTYHTYISTVPSLMWALFVGAWIDRYVKGRKILMLFAIGACIAENMITLWLSMKFDTSPYLMLLTHIPTSIFGGHIGARIAITHYVTSTTPPNMMSMRFMILEMCMFVANPIGSSLGGYLLVQKPLIENTGEIRNYSLIFIIATAFEIIAFLWILFMINNKVARKQELKVEMKVRAMNGQTGGEIAEIKLRSDMSEDDKAKHPISLLFDLDNIKLMIKTVIMKRPNKVRTQLFMIFGTMVILHMAHTGGHHVAGTFIQKIYLWKPDYQAYMYSLNMIIHSIATISIVPFMIRVMKITDIPLAIIGYLTYFISNLIRGTFLTPIAFYVCMAVQSIGGISFIGMRSHLTKIVERDEMGKVMSFVSALDTFAPMFSSTIFTFVFNATIDTYPGTVYQMTAGLIIIPICAMMWIDLFTKRPLTKLVKDGKVSAVEKDEIKTEEKKEDQNNIIAGVIIAGTQL